MRVIVKTLIAAAFLVAFFLPAHAQDVVQLSDLINEAMRNNLGLQAQRLNVEAAGLRIPQAGSWADPKLTIGLMNLPVTSLDLGIEPMTAKQVTGIDTLNGTEQKLKFTTSNGYTVLADMLIGDCPIFIKIGK